MYAAKPGLTLGFHGCDKSIVEAVVFNNQHLASSRNYYDWLGHGSYFWESSPSRALEFATTRSKRIGSSIKHPAVIGAVLDLGRCLDLLDLEHLASLKVGYDFIKRTVDGAHFSKLQNKPAKGSQDLLLRSLDCAVIEAIHKLREDHKLESYDSVRAVFWEGNPVYPNAGFREKDHIQICIRNPNCIKGCFLPRTLDKNFAPV